MELVLFVNNMKIVVGVQAIISSSSSSSSCEVNVNLVNYSVYYFCFFSCMLYTDLLSLSFRKTHKPSFLTIQLEYYPFFYASLPCIISHEMDYLEEYPHACTWCADESQPCSSFTLTHSSKQQQYRHGWNNRHHRLSHLIQQTPSQSGGYTV